MRFEHRLLSPIKVTFMDQNILNHYLRFGTYTYPGLYESGLKNHLPDDIKEIGLLVRKNIIHRTTLAMGNIGFNADLRFGDMTKVPWYRQPEDDVLVTAAAILAELHRRDSRGFVADRKEEDKLVLTCRFIAILMASILKSKGFPTRVRSGNANYFGRKDLEAISADHWINQYWNTKENRWVNIDVDGSLSLKDDLNPYDIPDEKFDFPADAWFNIRAGKVDPEHFYNAMPIKGSIVVAWSLFYDFHSLMNNEIIYLHRPEMVGLANFQNLSEGELKEIDNLALLMQKPDDNFDKLREIWETNKKFRLLKGGLL